MPQLISRSSYVMFFRLIAAFYFSFFLVSTAQAASTDISCVATSRTNGSKIEYEVRFDDADRTTIMVDGLKISIKSNASEQTLEAFGSSLIKWNSRNKSGSIFTYTIDRNTGSIELSSSKTDNVLFSGSCSKAGESRRF